MRDGEPYFLEVNPLPGLNPEDSDLIIMARLVGWNHGQVVSMILESAVARCIEHRRAAGLTPAVHTAGVKPAAR
jgi:hypothetical protein